MLRSLTGSVNSAGSASDSVGDKKKTGGSLIYQKVAEEILRINYFS
jgi:hypothetical protein